MIYSVVFPVRYSEQFFKDVVNNANNGLIKLGEPADRRCYRRGRKTPHISPPFVASRLLSLGGGADSLMRVLQRTTTR